MVLYLDLVKHIFRMVTCNLDHKVFIFVVLLLDIIWNLKTNKTSFFQKVNRSNFYPFNTSTYHFISYFYIILLFFFKYLLIKKRGKTHCLIFTDLQQEEAISGMFCWLLKGGNIYICYLDMSFK